MTTMPIYTLKDTATHLAGDMINYPECLKGFRLTGRQQSHFIDAAMNEPGAGEREWNASPTGELCDFGLLFILAAFRLQDEGRLEDMLKTMPANP